MLHADSLLIVMQGITLQKIALFMLCSAGGKEREEEYLLTKAPPTAMTPQVVERVTISSTSLPIRECKP
jgi:hypothetical protein